ncbi:OprD family porin [Pseudomonas monteilii]|uniref:Outer membrane porin, OprD family n=1 Tax=Pseudomonas monteilii TaxID=76759 RepID=A0A2N1IRU9_9PSED|nr:OprD family porin [Pseudomonas monteilii]PKI22284.1 outer membrane porin, OprD family [Pseudomonas monteilii]RPD94885.1 OprD family porin [Pseudomonas monteilii]
MKTRPHRYLKTAMCFTLVPTASTAFADFIGDGKGSLELRNFYYSRDFRDGTPSQSKREEWAQGFILNLQSGYTEGPIGFGVDAIGMLGIKLDSSPDRTGTGLLPRGADKRAADDYSKLAVTGKARLAQSELRIGGLNPVLPLLASNNSRLLPQVFNGAQLVSKDIKALTATLGQVDSVKLRDSSDSEELTVTSQFGGYSASISGDHYSYAGLDYQILPSLTLSYHISELEDIFQRRYTGIKFSTPLGAGKVFAEARYFDAKETGAERLGQIDNKTFSSNAGYSIAGHTFSAGYQKGSGESAFPYISGTDTYLFGEMLVSTFSLADEKAIYAGYGYDFAAVGMPGLTVNMRYVKGDDVDPTKINTGKSAELRALGEEGHEWERSTDIIYVVQSGPLKDFSLRWRNATNRSNFADSGDENRVIASYTYNF